MASDLDRVVPLDELDDFQVAEGDPDIRGWDVISADGKRVGEVDELLVDTVARKVRYLDVGIDEELLGAANDERHILIPIGYARLDREHDRVLVDTLNSADLGEMPEYSHAPLTREYETSLRRHFDPGYATPAGGEFYNGEAYDERRLYEQRRVPRPRANPEEEPGTFRDRRAALEPGRGREGMRASAYPEWGRERDRLLDYVRRGRGEL